MMHIEERAVYCRIVDVKRDQYGRRGRTLIGWRTRRRLYMTTAQGVHVLVPDSYGTSAMIRYMERGRLFLLTNGIY